MAAQVIAVEVTEDDIELLRQLIDGLEYVGDVRDLLEHLARWAADGVRRPGAWERGWIQQATGWSGS